MGTKRTVALLTACAAVFAFCFGGCGAGQKKKDTVPPYTYNGQTETAATETEPTEAVTEKQEEQTPALPVNPLTGRREEGIDLSQKCVGVVIENSPQARPQWGMSTPDIVMEYEVEGGISRMLWLYANADRVPESAGPVRSARHDIVELALGMDLLFVHCGGSPMALEKIRSLRPTLTELDGQTHDDYAFTRDYSRGVAYEHTLVLKGDKFRSALSALGLSTQRREGAGPAFVFTDEASPRTLPEETGEHLHFEISAYYRYDFDYNAESGKYASSLNGRARTDDQGIRCAYDNVILLYVVTEDLYDSDGHLDFYLENGGEGYYCCGGRTEPIRWEKDGEYEPLRLLTADGQPLELNPGTSYIGLVRSTNASRTVLS